uniref:Cadherin N-terminal domain-containing protein n=1 Tax=Neovison vison TaxID=452646 RepID=A0A8C7AZ83_NEOVI
MAAPKNYRKRGRLVLLCVFMGTLWEIGRGQIHYSVPEESDKGSFVGNISKDLNLESQELAKHGVRIVSRGRTHHPGAPKFLQIFLNAKSLSSSHS